MVKILLAAGHGPGDNRGGLYFDEGTNNFEYSLVLKRELDKYANVQVDLLRKKNTDNPALGSRAAKGAGYDLYASIHSNAADASVRGTEVFDNVDKPNRSLAKAICDTTAATFKHNNRGVKYKKGKSGGNYYAELRNNKAKSSMIIENGFHTNHHDCLFFKNNKALLAKNQAAAIAKHYNLKLKATTPPKTPNKLSPNEKMGIEAMKSLNKKGLIDNPKYWEGKVGESAPVWLIFELFDRFSK